MLPFDPRRRSRRRVKDADLVIAGPRASTSRGPRSRVAPEKTVFATSTLCRARSRRSRIVRTSSSRCIPQPGGSQHPRDHGAPRHRPRGIPSPRPGSPNRSDGPIRIHKEQPATSSFGAVPRAAAKLHMRETPASRTSTRRGASPPVRPWARSRSTTSWDDDAYMLNKDSDDPR